MLKILTNVSCYLESGIDKTDKKGVKKSISVNRAYTITGRNKLILNKTYLLKNDTAI